MKKLKGFLFGKSFPNDPHYIFGKIKYQGTKSGRSSLSGFIKQKEEGFLSKHATLLAGEDFTICFIDNVDASRVKFLSIIEKCMVFEFDFEGKTTKIQILKQGEILGERAFSLKLSTKRTKKILGLFGKGEERVDIEKTILDLFTTLTQNLGFKASVSNLLQKKELDIFTLSPPSAKYSDPFSYSSNATPFQGSVSKIMSMMPSPNGYPLPFKTDFDGSPMTEQKYCNRIMEYIRLGVVSPAILVQHNPLCVAVYSSDLDGVLYMNFNKDSNIARQFKHYKPMTKLLSVNMYGSQSSSGFTEGTEIDIIEGPNSTKRWKNFIPHIVDFLVDDRDKPLVDYWKRKFTKEEWQKTYQLTVEYTKRYPNGFRIGFLMYSQLLSLSFVEKFYPQYLDNDDVETVGK